MNEKPILFNGAMVRAILEGRKTQTRRVVKPQPSEFAGGVHPANLGEKTNRTKPYFDSYRNQRRSICNPLGMSEYWCWWTEDHRQGPDWIRCPYGTPGDLLWVRETWAVASDSAVWDSSWEGDSIVRLESYAMRPEDTPYERYYVVYRADDYEICDDEAWRRSIHMPRWASRITLRVNNVRVERVQGIGEQDAFSEGIGNYMLSDKWRGVPAGYRANLPDPVMVFSHLWDSINAKRGFSWDSNPWVWVVEFEMVN